MPSIAGGFGLSDFRMVNAELEIVSIKKRLTLIESALGIPQRLSVAQEQIVTKMGAAKERAADAQSIVDEYRKMFEELEKELLDGLLKEE